MNDGQNLEGTNDNEMPRTPKMQYMKPKAFWGFSTILLLFVASPVMVSCKVLPEEITDQETKKDSPAKDFATRLTSSKDFVKSFDLPAESKDGKKKRYPLVRNGTGLCEWGLFGIDLYRATLYVQKKSKDPDTIIGSKEAKCIYLRFVRSLSKKQMQEAFTAAFKVNAGKDLHRYEKKIDRFIGMMEGVSEGDSLIFSYVPDKGLEVRFGTKLKGKLTGEDFGALFFRLYLGDHPPDKNLKKGLMGLR